MTDQEKQMQVSPSSEKIVEELDAQELDGIAGGVSPQPTLRRTASAPAILQGDSHSISPVTSPGPHAPAAVHDESVATAQFWQRLNQAQERANHYLRERRALFDRDLFGRRS